MSLVGRENVYVCRECGGFTVTVDRDEGTTPMFLGCRASGKEGDCPGMAASSMYPKGPRPPWIRPPEWEWYHPDPEEMATLDEATRAHVEQFGLLIRPVRR